MNRADYCYHYIALFQIGLELIELIEQRCPYFRVVHTFGLSLLSGCPYFWVILTFGLPLHFGCPYFRVVLTFGLSLLSGYPYILGCPYFRVVSLEFTYCLTYVCDINQSYFLLPSLQSTFDLGCIISYFVI